MLKNFTVHTLYLKHHGKLVPLRYPALSAPLAGLLQVTSLKISLNFNVRSL